MSEPAPLSELQSATAPQPAPDDPLAGAELLSDALRSEMRAAADSFGDGVPAFREPEPRPREDFLLTAPEAPHAAVPATATAAVPVLARIAPPAPVHTDTAPLPRVESFLHIPADVLNEATAAVPAPEEMPLRIQPESSEPAPEPAKSPAPAAPAPWSVKAIAQSVRAEPIPDVPAFPVLSRMAQLMVPPPEEENAPAAEVEAATATEAAAGTTADAIEGAPADALETAPEETLGEALSSEPPPAGAAEDPAISPGDAGLPEHGFIHESSAVMHEPDISPLFAATGLGAVAAADAEARAKPAGPNDSPGLVLLGGVLVVGGLALAVRIPVLLMGHDPGYSGTGTLDNALRTAAALLHGAGSAALLTLGLGAATARRWAPPLIHGAGWAVLLGTLLILAQYSGLLFHGASGTGPDLSGSLGKLAFLTVAGIIFPLLAVAYCDRQRVLETCAAADPRPRWTDPLPVPVLMLFCTTLTMVAVCAAAAAGPLPFPLGGKSGPAPLWWVAAAVWAVSALLCMKRARSAWLLGLAGFLALGTVATLAFRTLPLQSVLSGAGSDPAAPVLIQPADFAPWATLLLPLLVILLMTRRAFGKS